ncbi:MAG: Tail Collar domain protein [Flavipsychrobacter sp.]|nr:Tail Collar domain protein [Flavipsychrobacter sp.]
MEAFIGSICVFGFNFAPRGWATCNGAVISIQQNSALFSLLGTSFGGNGTTTFGLPNLQGNAGVGFGQGPGLSNYGMGQTGGTTSVTLTASNMPAHTHGLNLQINAAGARGDKSDPTNNFPAGPSGGDNVYIDAPTPSVFMGNPAITLAPAGNNVPMSIVRPYLTMNYCVCTQGIFPSRN